MTRTGLERWLVVERGVAAATAARGGTGAGSRGRRGPGVVEVVAASAAAGLPVATTSAAAGGAEAAPTAAAAGPGHLLHLRRGVAQGRADLVDLELIDGALLALAGLVGP